MKRFILITLLATFFFISGKTQVKIPEESQISKINQHIGFTEINVSYSRPNMRGRTLFGSMTPWNSIWKIGANANTKFTVSKDVYLNDHKLPKGTYALYTIPNPEERTIIINTDTSLWGHYGYQEEKDFLRFSVKSGQSHHFHETFTIAFENVTKTEAHVILYWGNLRVPFSLRIDEDIQHQEVMALIKSKLLKPDDHDTPMMVSHNYLHAAMYYLEKDLDMEQALSWMDHAIKLENVSYFHLYKAEIL